MKDNTVPPDWILPTVLGRPHLSPKSDTILILEFDTDLSPYSNRFFGSYPVWNIWPNPKSGVSSNYWSYTDSIPSFDFVSSPQLNAEPKSSQYRQSDVGTTPVWTGVHTESEISLYFTSGTGTFIDLFRVTGGVPDIGNGTRVIVVKLGTEVSLSGPVTDWTHHDPNITTVTDIVPRLVPSINLLWWQNLEWWIPLSFHVWFLVSTHYPWLCLHTCPFPYGSRRICFDLMFELKVQ